MPCFTPFFSSFNIVSCILSYTAPLKSTPFFFMAALHSLPMGESLANRQSLQMNIKTVFFSFSFFFSFAIANIVMNNPAKSSSYKSICKISRTSTVVESKAMQICNFGCCQTSLHGHWNNSPCYQQGMEVHVNPPFPNHIVYDHFFFYFADISFIFSQVLKKVSHSFNSHFLYFE